LARRIFVMEGDNFFSTGIHVAPNYKTLYRYSGATDMALVIHSFPKLLVSLTSKM
jgi:hypothetical protein